MTSQWNRTLFPDWINPLQSSLKETETKSCYSDKSHFFSMRTCWARKLAFNSGEWEYLLSWFECNPNFSSYKLKSTNLSLYFEMDGGNTNLFMSRNLLFLHIIMTHIMSLTVQSIICCFSGLFGWGRWSAMTDYWHTHVSNSPLVSIL